VTDRLEHIARALEYQDTHTLQSVLDAIDAGRAQAWCGERSTIVTELLDFPLMRVCRIWLAGGDRSELVEQMLPQVEEWARQNGCSRVEIVGRQGWKRVLPEYSTPPQQVLHKSL
jgi:hypothetical protein